MVCLDGVHCPNFSKIIGHRIIHLKEQKCPFKEILYKRTGKNFAVWGKAYIEGSVSQENARMENHLFMWFSSVVKG